MFVEGTLRWQVTEDCPWDLLMALSLRDLGELDNNTSPAIPRVIPPAQLVRHAAGGVALSAPAMLAPVDREALQLQWEQWWHTIVRRELRPLITGLRPPHFAEFDRQLELQDLIIRHYDTALAWTSARHDEYARTSLQQHATRAADIVDIVRDREHELRRQAGYFRLDIAVLPLAEPGAWIVGPNSVVASQSLREDSASFRAWFRPFVEALV
ncbi:hypothetical protein [Rathayibacter soli]|uniref:hypothetical protein n=1 Tax=Rathayibacter soli TaxID=3144168 RepID=UPI0027E4D2C7|nr:hypothetical protein [Glaciibacter superstes]